MKLLIHIIFGLVILVSPIVTLSQIAEIIKDDSTSLPRFINVSENLMVNVRTISRSYSMDFRHVNSGNTLEVEPLGQFSLGMGVNYKWFGIAANFGLPSSSSDIEKYGDTQKQDFHIGIYGDKVSGLIDLQHYKGFHLENYEDTLTGNQIKLPSLETYSLNTSVLYFFNHKKFSFKAAYVRNAIQKRSAGSMIAGAFLTYDYASSEVPIGSENLPDSINDQFGILGITAQTIGVSLGYSYTYVFAKNFFCNGTIVPGIGLKELDLRLLGSTTYLDAGVSGRFDANLALGYEAENWLAGLTITTSNQFYEIEGLVISPNSSSFKMFVAKRFIVNRFKRKKRG